MRIVVCILFLLSGTTAWAESKPLKLPEIPKDLPEAKQRTITFESSCRTTEGSFQPGDPGYDRCLSEQNGFSREAVMGGQRAGNSFDLKFW